MACVDAEVDDARVELDATLAAAFDNSLERIAIMNREQVMVKGRIPDEEARERLIRWIRRRMDEFGITPQAIADSIQQDLAHRPLFRDARGNEWNGHGEMPSWLRAAQNAGVDPDFFRINPAQETAQGGKIDPRQLDLFA